MAPVKSSEQAGRPERRARVLMQVRIRTRIDEPSTRDWLASSGPKIQLATTSGSYASHEWLGYFLARTHLNSIIRYGK